jgi:outer membrane protein assembly factor BamB
MFARGCGSLCLLLPLALSLPAADQAQWGRAWDRNMVSAERGLPDSFDLKTGKNVKWSVQLGTQSYATPVVAGGRVYIGTNNGNPRDPGNKSDCGVLMCFEEATGKFLWQLAFPKREEDPYHDWPQTGMSSPVTVEGDRVYYVNNRGEVLCVEPRTTPEKPQPAVLWEFNLTTGAGIWSHDAAHSSILIRGDLLYLNSGTGVDNTHKKIRTPDAPSLVVLDKRSGRMVARDNEHIAPDIFHGTWSSPSLGEVNGRPLIFFAGGNGVIYAFEPFSAPPANETRDTLGLGYLKKVWWFDFDPTAPKEDIHKYSTNRREGPSTVHAMPVFDQGRIYAAGGGDFWWGKTEAWLKCIDATKTGNVTSNALIWSVPLQRHTLSTPAIADGLVYVADCGRLIYCVDATDGKVVWTQELNGEVWSSPMVADGKLFLGTRSGSFVIMAASREKRLISTSELVDPITATAVAANGVLYVATMTHLYALASR